MVPNRSFEEGRRHFFTTKYRVSLGNDAWHERSQDIVHHLVKTSYKTFAGVSARTLNAGSGGSDYGLSCPMTHLDLFASQIEKFPDHLVADVSAIPKQDSSYDLVICVGSVLNYTDPTTSLAELLRILRKDGLLFLEYERSASPEYWTKYGLGRSCIYVETFYSGSKTHLWVYSDAFIDGLINLHRADILVDYYFQCTSSLVLALSGSPNFASKFETADAFLKWIPGVKWCASNRFLVIKKLQ